MQDQKQLSAGLRAGIALEKHGFHPTYSLGQNFLLDDGFLSGLLDAAEIDSDENILEIGPGAGVMTALMAERAKRVLAVELDESLKPVLQEVLAPHDNVQLVFSDALRADLSTLLRESFGGAAYRVVANLPYYITADLILKLIQTVPAPGSICVMVQKEAAERLMSAPGEKQWCALAATVSYFGTCEVLEEVPPERFNPPPHVDSCFIRIRLHKKRLLPAEDEVLFLRLLRACFAMRRKTLANNLKAAFGLDQARAASILEQAGLDSRVRGEALELKQIAQLSGILKETL